MRPPKTKRLPRGGRSYPLKAVNLSSTFEIRNISLGVEAPLASRLQGLAIAVAPERQCLFTRFRPAHGAGRSAQSQQGNPDGQAFTIRAGWKEKLCR